MTKWALFGEEKNASLGRLLWPCWVPGHVSFDNYEMTSGGEERNTFLLLIIPPSYSHSTNSGLHRHRPPHTLKCTLVTRVTTSILAMPF